MTDLTIITRSLRARLFSTVTTVVTVAVAVALMLVLLMMRESASRAFQRGSGNMHLLVSRDQSPLVSVLNGIFHAGAPRSPILWDEYQRLIKARPYEFAVPIQLGDSYKARWPVVATSEEFFTAFQPAEGTPWKFTQGRAFNTEFEVVLGAAAARETGLRLGARIILTHGAKGQPGVHEHAEFKYEVVGILGLTGTPHDRALFTNLNSTWLIHAFDRREREAHPDGEALSHDHDHGPPITLADITPRDRQITNIYLRLPTRPGSDVSASTGAAAASLIRDPAYNPPLTVASPTTEINRLFVIVSNIDQILIALAAVVMISSGIAIMLALYNSMEQRRRQIAVLRVLGASRLRITGLILTESVMIGLMGCAGGVIVSLIGTQIVAVVMKERLGLVIAPDVHPTALVSVLLVTVGLAAAAGIVPAIMAYRTGVAKNLRPLG